MHALCWNLKPKIEALIGYYLRCPLKSGHPYGAKGFTLAELLIALTILGVIATFTIPKILLTQQNQQYNAEAKEAASMIAGAVSVYQLTNGLNSSNTFSDMTPYLNYVLVDTSTTIDDIPGYTSKTCSASNPCLKLHSGALLRYSAAGSFGGTSTTNALVFFLDPDGTYGGTTQGPSKAVRFALFYTNTRLTSIAYLPYTVHSSDDTVVAGLSDPSWFSW